MRAAQTAESVLTAATSFVTGATRPQTAPAASTGLSFRFPSIYQPEYPTTTASTTVLQLFNSG